MTIGPADAYWTADRSTELVGSTVGELREAILQGRIAEL